MASDFVKKIVMDAIAFDQPTRLSGFVKNFYPMVFAQHLSG
jgi:hypothetical protein